jgi:hypothetical protein
VRVPEPVPPGPTSDNPPAIAPAATVHCSIADFARYCAFHAAEGKAGPPLLSPDGMKKLHTAIPKGGWCSLGWIVAQRNWGGGDVLMHTGSNSMWYCAMWVSPGKNSAFVAATNIASDHSDDGCDAAIKMMVDLVLGGRVDADGE